MDKLQILQAKFFSPDGFFRCPNTGKILSKLPGDDKIFCGCGLPNPKIPREAPGVHIAKFLASATAEEYIAQGPKS